MLMQRMGHLVRRIFVPRAKSVSPEPRHTEVESRQATEPEIDAALDGSFPASDPVALHLEKDR